ncbi:MAG: hypothetical protein ACRBFS_15735 [Aureispira sp.]
MKGLSKGAVKKLLGNPKARTPFFLILNYFQDPSGKPEGHFLDFGTNKKLTKHFEQIEMKSGKLDKSMSSSQKEASMGEVYAEEKEGKKLLFFVPDENSKIPNGKWAKILKELKPLINSMKAFVVLDGEVVEDGEGTPDTSKEEPTVSLEELKALFKPISKMLKETLPKEIVPRIKSKTVTEEDDQAVDNLLLQVEEFLEMYEKGTAAAQEALAKVKATLEGQQDKINQIATAIKANIRATSTTETVEEQPRSEEEAQLLKNLEELLQQAQDGLADFEKDYERLQPELATPSAPIPSGDVFLTGIRS